jgi:predicted metal-binding membrane protein
MSRTRAAAVFPPLALGLASLSWAMLLLWDARPAWESFNLGVAHGVYCVGCCWALMLLMFVVGTGNIGWMLALGLLLVAKKSSLGPLDRRAAGREFANVGGTDHSHRHRDDSGLN